MENDSQQIEACLKQSVEEKWNELLNHLVEKYKDGLMKEKALSLISSEVKRLEQISKSIFLEESTCEPIVKWAQN